MKALPVVNIQVWDDGSVHFVRNGIDSKFYAFLKPTAASMGRIARLTNYPDKYVTMMLPNRTIMIFPKNKREDVSNVR